MASQYIQQPNGKWAIYSTCSDRLVAIDYNEQGIIRLAGEQARAQAEAETARYLEDRKAGIGTQFSIFWEEAVANTKKSLDLTVKENVEWLQEIQAMTSNVAEQT